MNEQKSFLAMLGLVVAAGLVLGMVMFNMGRGADPVGNTGAPTANTTATPRSSSQPSSDDTSSAAQPDGTIPPSIEPGAKPANEPTATSVDAPPLQAAGNGDPAPTASSDQPAGSETPPSTPQ